MVDSTDQSISSFGSNCHVEVFNIVARLADGSKFKELWSKIFLFLTKKKSVESQVFLIQERRGAIFYPQFSFAPS